MRKHPLALAFGVSALIVVAFALATWALGKGSNDFIFHDKVGVVEINAVIADSRHTNRALEHFRLDKAVKAVVIRVDSPGGGVAASQEIYREIGRLAKVKPVVCSMGGVAASGGYYVAAPCTKIVANPGTITGSIAVITSIPDLKGLMDKIGVKLQTVTSGNLKATGTPTRPLKPEERAMLQAAIDDTHEQFVSDVAKARKLPLEKVRKIANGGIFTGRRAKELGLVDRLGDFTDAVNLAAKLSGVTKKPKLTYYESEDDSWFGKTLRNQVKLIFREISGRFSYHGLDYLWKPQGSDS